MIDKCVQQKNRIMIKVKLYGLPHCSTCKKAVEFLENAGVEIEKFHDIKENRLSRKDVEKLVKSAGSAESLFSKRAMKYRAMGLHRRKLLESDMIDLMTDEYTFIRRPVLITGKMALAGFSKKKYEELIAL